jgi:hypothetical protein
VLRVGGKMMMPADLKLDIERIDHISDEMRAVVESEWPELAQAATRKAAALTSSRRQYSELAVAISAGGVRCG